MAEPARSEAGRIRIREHRERLRRQGLLPKQIWVADTRSLELAAEAHRESISVSASPHERGDQAFIDAISIRGER